MSFETISLEIDGRVATVTLIVTSELSSPSLTFTTKPSGPLKSVSGS